MLLRMVFEVLKVHAIPSALLPCSPPTPIMIKALANLPFYKLSGSWCLYHHNRKLTKIQADHIFNYTQKAESCIDSRSVNFGV